MTRSHRRWKLWICASLFAILAPTACGQGGSGGTPSSVAGGTVALRITGDWADLDIQTFTSANSWNVSLAMYDRLLGLGPEGKILPYLARSWKETASSITFNLRSDATCTDGTPITATVVANSVKRFASLPQATRYFGPGPYSVSADDSARTFTLTLGTPFSDAIYSFPQAALGIICPAGLTDPKQLTNKAFGSGPFVIESITRGESITLKARPEWKWGAYGLTATTPGFPQTLIYKAVTDESTAANLLITGGLDVGQVTGPNVPRLRNSSSLKYQVAHPVIVYPLVMNQEPPRPGADESVRRAIMTAVDPKAYNQSANAGIGQTGTSLFSANMPCYDPSTAKLMPKPSVQDARSILLKAGYVLGSDGKLQKDGKPLTISIIGPSTAASGPEYVATQLNQVGFNAVLNLTDYNTYAALSRGPNWDVKFPQLPSTVPTPYTTTSLFTGPPPTNGNNIMARVLDPVLDQEIHSALATTGSERCQHWANAQRRMLEKHVMLPLASPDLTYFSHGLDFQITEFIEPSSLKRR